jgi:hypothetical protein
MRHLRIRPTIYLGVCLVIRALLITSPLRAQELKNKGCIFIGGGIGLGLVTKNQLGKGISGFGPSFNARLGISLSKKSSLQLEYIVNHPNDETPQSSDILVTKEIINGNENHGLAFIRYPKLFQTRLLLISFQKTIFQDIYYRIGLGLGSNCFAIYRESKDAVMDASKSWDTGLGLGMAGGYERYLSSHLSLSLEASVRYSNGEDSTSARFVFGLGTVVKWDF